jgi:hypothetical protein
MVLQRIRRMVANKSMAEEEATGEMERVCVGEMTRDVLHVHIQRGPPAHVHPAVHNTSTVRDTAGQRGRKETGASVGG